ncbi:MAG: sugar transferase [Planctomycetales bacterium]|nr:sugar transferase [Planctomycetales bacterium]
MGWFSTVCTDQDFRLLSLSDFARQLRREKLRSDRTGLQFSLLDVRPKVASPASAEKLICEIIQFSQRRLRSTDDVGRTKDGAVSVLLVDTGAAGAEVVAEAFRAQFDRRITVTVHTHPWPDEEPQSDSMGQGGGSIRVAGARPRAPQEINTYMVRELPVWKRTIDVLGASFGLLLLSPLLIFVCLLIKLTSAGPVFYRQRRSGLGGRPFWIYKFRSMVPDADKQRALLVAKNEQDGPAFKIGKDPRVTPIGRLIRRTDIDELPQLWNVIRGEMSLVGPRPLPVQETAECENWHLERLQVTPGLTCTWQIEGRSRIVAFDDWMRMDLEYARSVNPIRDFQLIARTAWSVVVRRHGF